MRRTAVVACAVTLWAAPAVAQWPPFLPDLPAFGENWVDFSLPKIYYAGADGMTFGLYYAQVRMLSFDDADAPQPFVAIVSLDADISTSGSRSLRLETRMPRLSANWRASLTLEGTREARAHYFGIGNDAIFDKSLASDAAPHYYRYDRRRMFVRAEVQRRIVGPLRVLAGIHAERWTLDTLSGASQLALDAAAGTVTAVERGVGDVAGRVGLVFDSRDDEPAPHRGVLFQAIVSRADSSVMGSATYTRLMGSATAYLPVTEQLGVAARVVGQSLRGDPPIGSYYLIEASDHPYVGLGGPESHRALAEGRFLDGDKLFANLDLRYDLYWEPTLFRATVVGFMDAGRVFPPGTLEVTTKDLKVGGGLGVFLQFFRSGIVGTTLGLGPDGLEWDLHTGWPF